MAKYVAVGREVREAMFALTPLVEPLSIDEAFLDLAGTERLHGMSPAKAACALCRDVSSASIGITVSIGLSANKFLAKIASDLDKPRGFAVLGPGRSGGIPRREAGRLHLRRRQGERGAGSPSDGFRTIADLQRADERDLMRRYGEEGARLCAARPRHRLPHGRSRTRHQKRFGRNHVRAATSREFRPLEQHLWDLTETVSTRLKASALAGSTVTLKLKSADFKTRTRARSLGSPTQLAARIFAAGRDLLAHEVGTTRYRLIGIGVSNLDDVEGDEFADLIDRRAAEAEHAVDRLRSKFGRDVVVKGLALDEEPPGPTDKASRFSTRAKSSRR